MNGTCEQVMAMDCAVEVKKEVNTSWILSAVENDPHRDSLLCAERFSGSSGDVRLKSSAKTVKSSTEQSALTSTNSESTESSTDDEPKSPLPSLLSPIHSPEGGWSTLAQTTAEPLGLFAETEKDVEEEDEEDDDEEEEEGRERGEEEEEEGDEEEEEEDVDGEERTETEKSGDEKSSLASSEKESSPVCSTSAQSKQPVQLGGSPVTVGEKRKRSRETEEEYESRRIARRESLKFVVDFCECFFSALCYPIHYLQSTCV